MEQKLIDRNSCKEEIIRLAEDTEQIGAVISYGDDATECLDLRIDVVPNEDSNITSAYARLTYLVSSELEASESTLVQRDANRRVKRFLLTNGVTLTLGVTELDSVVTDGWFNICADWMNAASELHGAVSEDILCDIGSAAEVPPLQDEPDSFDEIDSPEEPSAEPEPEPQPEPQPEPESHAEENAAEEAEDDDMNKYLDYITRNLRSAQRAIAAGQMIRAGEITAILRKMAIELICVRNGITEGFEQAIDFIDCEEKKMLYKTYPKNMDQKSLVTALSTLSELFDRLV